MSILVRTFFKNTWLHPTSLFLLVFGIFWPVLASAEPNKPECLPDWIAPPVTVPPTSTTNQTGQVEAFKLQQPNSFTYELFGNVSLKRPGLVVLAEQARINRQAETADVWGKVHLYRQDLMMTAQQASLQQNLKTAQAEGVAYQFMDSRAHGTANRLKINQNEQRIQLEAASYSTCKLNPYQWQVRDYINTSRIDQGKKLAWHLDFSDLDINNVDRRIYGHNALLYFQTVPIFYTPYLSLPMDNRASGLLFPLFGSRQPLGQGSSENYLSLPYYVNLAPNADDTVTLIKMQNRGWVLDNEFRYLGDHGQSELTLTGINDQLTTRDGLAELDSLGKVTYGDKQALRWRGKLVSQQQWQPNISSDILWHEVSDKGFYNDIPVETTLNNVTQTERHVNLNFQQDHLNGQVSLLNYLRLRKDAAYNYEKRPEVTLNYVNDFDNLNVDLLGQVTEFDIPLDNHKKPEAQRALIKPTLQYGYYRPYGKFETSLIANHTRYTMQNNAYNTTGENGFEVTVPQLALRGGLNFERDLQLGEMALVQTLEPEIQYLYTPYQDQSKIPLFDTSLQTLDFSNLFSLNRFSGSDRIGDANQVSAALTTRFLTVEGNPLFEAGLGQIFYLADRQVQLSNLAPQTDKVSDYFVKLGTTLGDLSFYSTSQYGHNDYALTNANNRLKIDVSPKFKLLLTHTLSYANQPSKTEVLAAGVHWKINDRWALGSYWNYDFTHERRTEVQHALRYESCCWASELSVQETQLLNGLYNYSIQYVFELKGLSSVGTTFTDYLQNKLNF